MFLQFGLIRAGWYGLKFISRYNFEAQKVYHNIFGFLNISSWLVYQTRIWYFQLLQCFATEKELG